MSRAPKSSVKSPWTAAQTRAIGLFETDVCVPAGAGSGKTAVLVERYLHAVEKRGLKPSEILAITFTDKAAAEMKRRLIDESSRRGLRHLRSELETAPIGTIHAFCARLLRENPVECGIDPEFRILGDGERELVLVRVFDALVEAQAQDPRAIEALALYGEENTRRAFARLQERLRAAGLVAGRPAEPDFATEARDTRNKLEKALEDILKFSSFKKEPGKTEAAAAASARAMLEALAAPGDDWQRLDRVAEADDMAARGGIKEAVTAAREAFDAWQAAEAARLSLPLRRAFMKLFGHYGQLLEEEKKRLAAYDFDDLIDKALRALSGGDPVCRAFAERTRARFRAVFVDEYQDVNPAQAALVDLLKTAGNGFVVGDRRQSIYGFRHADPEIFERIRAASQCAPLSDNFRSRKAVLDFINAFFADRFPGDEPLVAAKPYGPKAQPSVEILAVPVNEEDEGDKPLDRARVREAGILAARIRALVDSRMIVEPKNEPSRPVEWRDIAILFRKGTAIRLYDRAFRDAGIPFDLPKGKGFFEKNEIVDLISFLTILNDPYEDIPLAAVLRSPLTGLSDDALFLLAQARPKDGSFFEAALACAAAPGPLAPADRERLGAFLSRLERLRASRERLGVSRLIETVLDETGYRLILAAVSGPQAPANVDKLIDLARECESAGGGTADFVRLARVLADRDDDEPEAKMPADRGNAVSFLTVHAAKGLEFPVVAVADMGAQPKKDRPFFMASASGEIGLKLKSPEGWDWIADPVYRRLQVDAAARAACESDRLLYVAMTRAREHLILSGAWKKPGKSEDPETEKSWMRMLFETCGFDEPHTPGPEAWKGTPVCWLSIDAAGTPAAAVTVQRLADEPAMRAALRGEGPPPQGAGLELMRRLTLPEKPYEMAEDVTVTRLVEAASREELAAFLSANKAPADLWAEEPDKAAGGRDDQDGDEEPPVPANRFGTVFHKLMELSVRSPALKAPGAEEFESWTREFGPAEKDDLRRQAETFWKGEWGGQVRSASKRYPELPFIFKTPHGLLKGQIDLVFKGADGRWTILDYKTNRIAEKDLASTAGRYEFQLALYAYVFAELTGQRPSRGVLYFSAIGLPFSFEYKEKMADSVRERLERAHAELIFPAGSAKMDR